MSDTARAVSVQWRRPLHLADAFAERLGGWASLSDMTAAEVRKAAELVALAEEKRHEALRDGCVDADQVVRLENAAARAVRALGLPHRRRDRVERVA